MNAEEEEEEFTIATQSNMFIDHGMNRMRACQSVGVKENHRLLIHLKFCFTLSFLYSYI